MANKQRGFFSHETLEKNIGWMIIASILVVSFAGLVQIIRCSSSTARPRPSRASNPTARCG